MNATVAHEENTEHDFRKSGDDGIKIIECSGKKRKKELTPIAIQPTQLHIFTMCTHVQHQPSSRGQVPSSFHFSTTSFNVS